MKFSQFIEDSSLSFNSPITQEEWDRITDVELENTEIITFKIPSGKEVPFRKVKHGEWLPVPKLFGTSKCSLCGEKYGVCGGLMGDYNFCPNCGADMRGEENDCNK